MDNSFEHSCTQEKQNNTTNTSIAMKPYCDAKNDVDEEVPMTFPQRLMEILANEAIADTVSWLPHGKGFIIYKKKKFAAEVLPKYFKQSKFTSFTRKLNRWGFNRVTRGPETGAYYHKFFQQGDLRLCMQMSCQSTKATMGVGFITANHMPNNMFAASSVPGENDIAQQNQSMIRHQLQQLQMQQLQLQQLQLQQQQQIQASEFMRQALSKQNGGGQESDMHLGMMDPSAMFLQTLQRTKDSGTGLMGTGPIALLPSNNPGMGEPTRPAAGNGRAWAA